MSTINSFFANISDWLRHHSIAASLIILVASTAPRVFLAWRTDPSEVVASLGDPAAYVRTARSLLRQQAFLAKYGKPEITRTPGYPAFLATIMLLVGEDLHTVLIVQAFILSCSVLVLYWFAR